MIKVDFLIIFRPISKHTVLFFSIVLSILLFQLFFFSPLYDLDFHFYSSGALHWDIQHPPMYNILISIGHKIYPSIYVPILFQIVVFAVASGYLFKVIIKPFQHKKTCFLVYLTVLSACFVGFELVSSFYHVSLLSESLFLSFTLLMVSKLILYQRTQSQKQLIWSSIFWALAFLTRYQALFSAAIVLMTIISTKSFYQGNLLYKAKTFTRAFVPFIIAFVLLQIGHRLINQGNVINNLGILFWHNSNNTYISSDCHNPKLQEIIAHNLFPPYLPQEYAKREAASRVIIQEYSDYLIKTKGLSKPVAFVETDKELGKVAKNIYKRNFVHTQRVFIKQNTYRAIYDNYLEYRHLGHAIEEKQAYIYLDGLMVSMYNFSYQKQFQNPVFSNEAFLNSYMQVVFGVGFLGLLFFGYCVVYKQYWSINFIAWLIPIVMLLFTFYSYKTRFVGVYTCLLFYFGIELVLNLIFQLKKKP